MNIKPHFLPLFIVILLSSWLVACQAEQTETSQDNSANPPVANNAIDGNDLDQSLRTLLAQHDVQALNKPVVDPAKVDLGEKLFFDKILSGNRDVSCATCHHPVFFSGDGLSLPIGVGGIGLGTVRSVGSAKTLVPRNAPEVFNRGDLAWRTMFWDNRVTGTATEGFTSPAGDLLPPGLENPLAVQAMFPPTSREEMRGHSGDLGLYGDANEVAAHEDIDFPKIWDDLTQRVIDIPEYETMIAETYPNIPLEDLGFEHLANAIAAYEIDAFTLLDSPWDQYLAGDDEILAAKAKKGAVLFYSKAGCSQCHSGSLLTDQAPHNIALPQLGPGKGTSAPLDEGRSLETNEAVDKFCFRTPPLRNVALTGPWGHNGAYTDLELMVRHHLNPQDALRNYDTEQLDPLFQAWVKNDPETQAKLLNTLDPLLTAPTSLNEEEIAQLMAFLHSLTAPSAMQLQNEVPGSVPSGLPVIDVVGGMAENETLPGTLLVPSEYNTIAAAIDAAQPGDILHIAPGTYAETLLIDKPLALQGEAGQTIITGNGAAVITIANTNDVRLENLVIEGGELGISVENGAQISIVGNHLHDQQQTGISLRNGQATIHDNVIEQTAGENGYGVSLADTRHWSPSQISGNRIEGHRGGAILLQNAAEAKIEENLIQNNAGFGMRVEIMSQAVISGNLVMNNHNAAVSLFDRANATINANQLSGTDEATDGSADGIRLNRESTATITANQILDNGRCGIAASGQSTVSGSENILQNNRLDNLCGNLDPTLMQ